VEVRAHFTTFVSTRQSNFKQVAGYAGVERAAAVPPHRSIRCNPIASSPANVTDDLTRESLFRQNDACGREPSLGVAERGFRDKYRHVEELFEAPRHRRGERERPPWRWAEWKMHSGPSGGRQPR